MNTKCGNKEQLQVASIRLIFVLLVHGVSYNLILYILLVLL